MEAVAETIPGAFFLWVAKQEVACVRSHVVVEVVGEALPSNRVEGRVCALEGAFSSLAEEWVGAVSTLLLVVLQNPHRSPGDANQILFALSLLPNIDQADEFLRDAHLHSHPDMEADSLQDLLTHV